MSLHIFRIDHSLKEKMSSNIFNRTNELTEIEKRKLAKMEKKNQKLLIMTIYLKIYITFHSILSSNNYIFTQFKC